MSLLANCKSIFWIQQSSWFLRYAKDATITTRDIASRSLHTANWTSDANQHDATARPLYSVYEFCFRAVSRLISSDTRVRSFSLSTPPKVKSLKSEEIQWIISVFVLEYIRRTVQQAEDGNNHVVKTIAFSVVSWLHAALLATQIKKYTIELFILPTTPSHTDTVMFPSLQKILNDFFFYKNRPWPWLPHASL